MASSDEKNSKNSFQQAPENPETLRSLPASFEAEKGVLSCILRGDEEHIGVAISTIKSGDTFHHPHHKNLYEIITTLYQNNVPRDIITISQHVLDNSLEEQIGGIGYLNELFDYAATTAHFEYYLDILQEKRILRTLISTCTTCITEAYQGQQEVATLLDSVEQNILSVRASNEKSQVRTMKDEVYSAIEVIEERNKRGGGLSGISSGFDELDKRTGGLNSTEMFIIAARPGMGKTSLVMNIIENVSVEQNIPSAVFSLEMSTQSLVMRLLCSLARIDMKSLSQGMMQKRDRLLLMSSASKLSNAPIFIDDTPSLPILELRAKARRLKKQHDIQLIAVDYLQLMRSNSKRAQDNRQQEIAEISAGLKAIAKELNIPVIVLAQLNRNPEQRTGKSSGKPKLSDLRESGSIEQDADIVGLLYRDMYYAEGDEEREASKGLATLNIAKQRNGPTGEIPLTFIDDYMRFENRSFQDDAEPS